MAANAEEGSQRVHARFAVGGPFDHGAEHLIVRRRQPQAERPVRPAPELLAEQAGGVAAKRGNRFRGQLPGKGDGDVRDAISRLDPPLRVAQKQERRPLIRQHRRDLGQATRTRWRRVVAEERFDRAENTVHRSDSHLEKALVGFHLTI